MRFLREQKGKRQKDLLMKTSFVDTNVFLEVFARKGERSDRCLALLEGGKKTWTSSFVVAEIEWVLRSGYELKREEIVFYLKRLFLLSNLKVENRKILLLALDLYDNSSVDWVDCVNALLMKKKGLREIYSYDKHYDKFDWVVRREP